MTNADKFEEVFGYQPQMECIIPDSMCMWNMNGKDRTNRYASCDQCDYLEWWEREYEVPDKLPFE